MFARMAMWCLPPQPAAHGMTTVKDCASNRHAGLQYPGHRTQPTIPHDSVGGQGVAEIRKHRAIYLVLVLPLAT